MNSSLLVSLFIDWRLEVEVVVAVVVCEWWFIIRIDGWGILPFGGGGGMDSGLPIEWNGDDEGIMIFTGDDGGIIDDGGMIFTGDDEGIMIFTGDDEGIIDDGGMIFTGDDGGRGLVEGGDKFDCVEIITICSFVFIDGELSMNDWSALYSWIAFNEWYGGGGGGIVGRGGGGGLIWLFFVGDADDIDCWATGGGDDIDCWATGGGDDIDCCATGGGDDIDCCATGGGDDIDCWATGGDDDIDCWDTDGGDDIDCWATADGVGDDIDWAKGEVVVTRFGGFAGGITFAVGGIIFDNDDDDFIADGYDELEGLESFIVLEAIGCMLYVCIVVVVAGGGGARLTLLIRRLVLFWSTICYMYYTWNRYKDIWVRGGYKNMKYIEGNIQ